MQPIYISLSGGLTQEQWDKLNSAKKAAYIKKHPDSKYAKEAAKPESDTKQSVKKKVKEKVKHHLHNVAEEHRKMFHDGDHKAGSPERRKLGKLMKDKAKGVVKALKHEVKEWKEAGTAVKKIATGKELRGHEKKALKTVAIHAAMVIVPMAVTGGLAGGLTSAAKGMALGFLEHTALIRGAQVAVFASDSVADMTEEEALEYLVKQMGDSIAEAKIPTEDWIKAVQKK